MEIGDITKETNDDLRWAAIQIRNEQQRRNEEPKKRIWITNLNDGQSIEYFKKYADAKTSFLDDMDFTVLDTPNKYSIEHKMISESEYNSRPDRWW